MTEHDKTFDITVPPSSPYALHRSFHHNDTHNPSGFRSRASELLEQEFPNQAWTMREGSDGRVIHLEVAVKIECIDDFRTRMNDLDFGVRAKDGAIPPEPEAETRQ